MAWKVKAQIDGLAGVLEEIRHRETSTRRKVLRGMARAGGNVVLRRAKQLVPRDTGLLKESLGSKVVVYEESSVGVAIIGPRKGFRRQILRSKGKWKPAPPPPSGYADPTKYGHLVELGVASHTLKKRNIQHPGHRAYKSLTGAAMGQTGVIREAMANAAKKELGI